METLSYCVACRVLCNLESWQNLSKKPLYGILKNFCLGILPVSTPMNPRGMEEILINTHPIFCEMRLLCQGPHKYFFVPLIKVLDIAMRACALSAVMNHAL